jgi:molybdenum cofactor cytidylyltransferase
VTEGKATQRFEAVVLAAGAGARFGGGKLLAPWRGGALIDGALAAALAAPVRQVSVVWGADAMVADAVRAFAARVGAGERLRLVHAARHTDGLSASLRAGVEALAADCAGVFIFLGDMPKVPTAVLAPLGAAVAGGAPAAAPVFGGRRGHPVLFGAGLLPGLLSLSGDRGAAGVLDRLGERLRLVAAPDDGVLFDVDRPGDLG